MFNQFTYKAGRLTRDIYILIQFIITSIFQLGIWGYLLAHYRLYSENTFLHYTVGVNVDYIGAVGDIFVVPIIGLMIVVLNALLAYLYYEKVKILSYFFVTLTNILHVFLFISSVLIVSLNI